MGLFQQRPEMHNDEWGGLPSEPLTPHSPADNLENLPNVDAVSLTDLGGAGVTSVNIALPTVEQENNAKD